MFPTIFSLGVEGLGDKTHSAVLVCYYIAGVGSAIVPMVTGMIADATSHIDCALIVPAICYFYILYCGWFAA
jgi:FHS family L-fucose permease-like MFS transporter